MRTESNHNVSFCLPEEIVERLNNRHMELSSRLGKHLPVEHMGCSGCNPDEKRCGIMLTNKCQLRCTYCYERDKDALVIDAKTAIAAIESELKRNDGTRRIHIDLFGGEPFLAFDVMRDIVDHLKSHQYDKSYFLSTITNGVAVHGERQQWLVDNRGIIECILSLDGTREMQQRNRPGSFDRIDIGFFAREFPGMRVKMTVSDDTVSQLAEGTIYLHSLGFSPQNGIAYGITWSDTSLSVFEEQLGALVEYYTNHPDVKESLLLKLPYRDIAMRRRTCDAGSSMVMYDVDGRAWPCHMFLPQTIGLEKAQGVPELDFSLDQQAADSDCSKCPIENSCVVCRGTNYSTSGVLGGKDTDVCRFNRLSYRAKGFLAANKWAKGLYSWMNDHEELVLIEAIRRCSELNNDK